MPVYCLDASALVIYITGEGSRCDLKKIMKEIEAGRSKGIISVHNLGEFHRAVTRLEGEETADKYIVWLKESRLRIVQPTVETVVTASVKKQRYASGKSPFAWGDAVCLATALEQQADSIITSDTDFKKIKELPIILC